MEDPGNYEALSAGDEQGGEIRWPKGQPHATLAPTREGQPQEKDTQRMGARLSEFLPLVGRSATDKSNGGDISPARVVVGEVGKVNRR